MRTLCSLGELSCPRVDTLPATARISRVHAWTLLFVPTHRRPVSASPKLLSTRGQYYLQQRNHSAGAALCKPMHGHSSAAAAGE